MAIRGLRTRTMEIAADADTAWNKKKRSDKLACVNEIASEGTPSARYI